MKNCGKERKSCIKNKETFNCNLEERHKSACGYIPVHIKHENWCSLK